MEYRVTYDECLAKIGDVVCTQCGGELSPLETVDNSHNPTHWVGCEACCVFNNGVPIEIYNAAVKMVDIEYYYHYCHIGSPKNEYERLAQISGACDTIRTVFRCYTPTVIPDPDETGE